jgi:hypothetical protein
VTRPTTSHAVESIPEAVNAQPRVRPGNLLSTCRFNQWGEPIPHVTVSQDFGCGTGRGRGQTRIRVRTCLNCDKFNVTLIGSMASGADFLEQMLSEVDAYPISKGPQHESFEQPGYEYAKDLLPARKRRAPRKLPRRRRAA